MLYFPNTENEPNLFSLKVNHGGHFTYFPGPKRTRAPRRVYKDGEADWFDDVDADGFSVIEVTGMLKELGYVNPKMKVYFKRPTQDLDNGLEPLFKDVDVLDMISYVNKFKLMEVFVEHHVDTTVIENVDLDPANDGLGNENVDLGQSSEPRPRPSPSPIVDEFDPLFSYPATNNDMGQSSEPTHSPNETSDGREGSDRSDSNDESEGSDRSKSNDDSEEDSEDSDFECDLEDQINDPDVDMEFFRKNTDPSVEWVGSAELDPSEVEADVDIEYEECDLEDFDSEIDSDDDEAERKRALRKLAKSHKPVDGNVYTENFYVSQTFANKELIKEMMTRIAVNQRRQIYLTKNDKGRVRAECRGLVPTFSNSGPSGTNVDGLSEGQSEGPSVSQGTNVQDSNVKKTKKKGCKAVGVELKCPWLLHCQKPKGEGTWYVKIFQDNHTCLKSRTVPKCTASFLAKEIEQTIKPNPKIPISALKDQLTKKYELGLSKQKIFRAKQMAEEKVIGDHTKQYAQLRQYCLELKEKNPNTTVKIDVERTFEPDSQTRKFRRIYVCLGALKSGFKAGQRDLLGLDGCFMSGPFPSQILTAVGVDPNNGTYPLAYAVVEAETKQSWIWFLECLGDDLDLVRNSNFTFVTDRQKVNTFLLFSC